MKAIRMANGGPKTPRVGMRIYEPIEMIKKKQMFENKMYPGFFTV